jgi:hypothetical protein
VDPDKNQNPALVENVTVNLAAPGSGDVEQVQLQETGVSTGVFVGYIPSGAPPAPSNNCVLAAAAGQNVTAQYTDPLNSGDVSNDSARYNYLPFSDQHRTLPTLSFHNRNVPMLQPL